MRRTKEDAEQTKRDLLDAALRIFSRTGYEAARLQDIADEAGVTRGAIYHHFESKAGLYLKLVEEANAEGGEVIAGAAAQGGTLLDIVGRILADGWALLEDNRRYREIMALTLFKTGQDPELAHMEQLRREQSVALVEGIQGFMAQGVASGELRSDLDPATAARAFLALQNGVAFLWLANPDAFSIKEQAAPLAEIYLRGIMA